MCSGLAKQVKTLSTGTLMSIDFVTNVNGSDFRRLGFKGFEDFRKEIDLQYIYQISMIIK